MLPAEWNKNQYKKVPDINSDIFAFEQVYFSYIRSKSLCSTLNPFANLSGGPCKVRLV